MKKKCIYNNNKLQSYLTVGDEYAVLFFSNTEYFLKNDIGNKEWYNKDLFEGCVPDKQFISDQMIKDIRCHCHLTVLNNGYNVEEKGCKVCLANIKRYLKEAGYEVEEQKDELINIRKLKEELRIFYYKDESARKEIMHDELYWKDDVDRIFDMYESYIEELNKEKK